MVRPWWPILTTARILLREMSFCYFHFWYYFFLRIGFQHVNNLLKLCGLLRDYRKLWYTWFHVIFLFLFNAVQGTLFIFLPTVILYLAERVTVCLSLSVFVLQGQAFRLGGVFYVNRISVMTWNFWLGTKLIWLIFTAVEMRVIETILTFFKTITRRNDVSSVLHQRMIGDVGKLGVLVIHSYFCDYAFNKLYWLLIFFYLSKFLQIVQDYI